VMKRPKRASFVAVAVVASGLLACVGGCANTDARVSPLPNPDVAALDADHIVRIMRRAGFSDEEIVDLGTQLRNILGASGAAKIQVGQKVEAIFAVDGRCLHGTSRRRGSFVYQLDNGKFR